MEAYAVVETGGKQYRVEAGQTFDIERLKAEAGTEVELAEVLGRLRHSGEDAVAVGHVELQRPRGAMTVIVPGLECAVSRHVPLSWDPGGVVLLYPDCVARGYGGTSWPVAPGWLTAGTTYYWRVRELSNLCAYSALWSFTTTADAPVHLSGLRIE